MEAVLAALESAQLAERSGDYARATELYRQSLNTDPESTTLRLAVCLGMLSRHAESSSLFERAIELSPANAQAWAGLGTARTHLGDVAAAIVAFDRALELDPSLAGFRRLRGGCRYVTGNYGAAWPDLESTPLPPLPRPCWEGESLAEKTILLFQKQGLGDWIQFVRYVPLVKERAGRVVLGCPTKMQNLLSSVGKVDEFASRLDATGCDCHAQLFSLPRLLNLPDPEQGPRPPYIFADPTLVETWKRELDQIKAFKVGINWQGSPAYSDDRFRSIPFPEFLPLARVSCVRLISLQHGYGLEQLHASKSRNAVVDFGSRLDRGDAAFLDTAAAIENIDLVITSDTALAHLAGALGRPTWLVLSKVPDWRWMRSGERTPWYPSMRIFRQQTLGDWASVFAKVKAELRRLVMAGPKAALAR